MTEPPAYEPSQQPPDQPQSAPEAYGSAPPPGQAYPPGPYPGAYAAGGPAGAPRNGMGVAALILGIVALLGFWTIFLGIVLGLLAVIFGVVGRKRANRREASNGSAALAGAILGGIALAGSLLFLALVGAFFVNHKSDIEKFRDCANNAQTDQQRQSCTDQFGNDING
jgi:Domain of unknown function (DUF4190)